MRLTVEIDKIRPNPFRDFGKEPIQQDNVDRLVKSIESTGFWDNIMVRPAAGCCIEYRAHDVPTNATICNESWFSFQDPKWPHGEYDVVVARCVGFPFDEFNCNGDEGDLPCVLRDKPFNPERCFNNGCEIGDGEEDLGYFELAYGHHRLEALKSLGIEEIEVECRILSDEEMLKIMAADNNKG